MGWIILAIVVILVIAIISMYNGLVSARVKVDNAWSQIDVQLQRRFDLIPNFVETVKGYATHESETFEKITKLRTSWASAGTVAEKAELDNQLSGALKTIMAVSENYPDLIVRVAGYSAVFVNLTPDIQAELLSRALYD
mgnify:CR=1 FL=1